MSLLLSTYQVSLNQPPSGQTKFSYIHLNTGRLGSLNNTQIFISYLTGNQPVLITQINDLMLYKIVLFLIRDSRSGWGVNFTHLPLHFQAKRLAYLLNRRLDRPHSPSGGSEEEIYPCPDLKSSHDSWNVHAVAYNIKYISLFAILATITLISQVKLRLWK